MKHFKMISVALFASLFVSVGVTASELRSVPGTPVSLTLPDDYVASPRGPGFENVKSGASVFVLEMPSDTYADIAEVYSLPQRIDEVLEKNGFPSTAQVEKLTVGSRDYVLLSFEMNLDDSVRTKNWIAITGPDPAVMIQFVQVELPGFTTQLDRDAVVKMLDSVQLKAATSFQEQLKTIGLNIDPTPPFSEGMVVGGMFAVLSRPGERAMGTSYPKVMLMKAVPGIEKAPLLEIANYMAFLDGSFEVQQSIEAKFAGEIGLRRQLLGMTSGHQVAVLQYVSVVDGRAVSLSAQVLPAELTPAMIGAIDTMAASVRPLE